jgi:hypothetical protein
MTKRNSALFQLVKEAMAEALEAKAEVGSQSLHTPKDNLPLMRRLIKQGKSDREIKKVFLDRFAYSGRDKKFVIRFCDVAKQLVSRRAV